MPPETTTVETIVGHPAEQAGTKPAEQPTVAKSTLADARKRIGDSLAELAKQGYAKGWRGPKKEQAMVEAFASDVRALTAAAKNQDSFVVRSQKQGCAPSIQEQRGKQDRKVILQADCCWHLMEQSA